MVGALPKATGAFECSSWAEAGSSPAHKQATRVKNPMFLSDLIKLVENVISCPYAHKMLVPGSKILALRPCRKWSKGDLNVIYGI
jgi:hypothetical protein